MLDITQIILVILFSILALSCIITNSLICYVIVTRTTTNGVFKYYIFSLAITDILIGIVSIPAYITVGILKVPHGTQLELLLLVPISDMFLSVCSMCHISLMALDRTMAHSRPIFHRIHMKTRKAALKLSALPWLSALLIVIVNYTALSYSAFRCVLSSVTGIAIPFVFTVVCYIAMYVTIRNRNEQFSIGTSTPNVINEMKIMKMILCVLAVYLICWLPFAVVNAANEQIFSSFERSKVPYIICAVKFLQFMNSTCNPFVYAIFYKCFRIGVKDVLLNCFCKKATPAPDIEPQSRTTRF